MVGHLHLHLGGSNPGDLNLDDLLEEDECESYSIQTIFFLL